MIIKIISNFPDALNGKQDMRFTYLANLLVKRGHNVELIISDFDHEVKDVRKRDDYSVYDFKITADLSELKNKINNDCFTKLFQKLKDVQMKCNDLVDNYNNVNINSYGNIRDSVKDIKVSCIKALDDLKEKIKIKEIVNNPQIFKDFDIAYKQLGKKMNEKFKQNIEIFKKLNQQVSFSVSNLIEKIVNLILNALEQALDEKQYFDIKLQINEKIILPVDRDAIINQFNSIK
jgi:hypothetical protein